jgi:hypothetical protein
MTLLLLGLSLFFVHILWVSYCTFGTVFVFFLCYFPNSNIICRFSFNIFCHVLLFAVIGLVKHINKLI